MAKRQKDGEGESVSRAPDHTVPFDEVAEQSVLGAALLNAEVIREIGGRLKIEDFYRESHRAIFTAMSRLDESQAPIDVVTVRKKLLELGMLQTAGGGAYLAQLATKVPSATNAIHYAEIVRQKAVLRNVIEYTTQIQNHARGEIEDVGQFVDGFAQGALQLSSTGAVSSVVHIRDVLAPAIDAVEKMQGSARRGQLTGVTSGFHALDRKTSGWQPSDLIILAARPGMGKTAFVLNMLTNAAKDKRDRTPGVIFSLEMSKEQLVTRMWCAESRVPMEQVRTGDLDSKTWSRLIDGAVSLNDTPIFVDDTPALPITEMMRKSRQLKVEHNIGLIVVDYLQLMSPSNFSKNVSREQQISEISRNLKALAKELHVPVIALSQLNRGVESRQDKRPMLSDLRESGAIEQDADIIVFLYREDYYEQMKGKAPGEGGDEPARHSSGQDPISVTEVLIAKHRSGSTGKVELQFHAPYTLFTNLPGDGPPPPSDSDRPPFARDDSPQMDYAPPPPQPPSVSEFSPFHADPVDDDESPF